MNEIFNMWVMWVNGNYDVLIMTITLVIVAGLVLEVIKLNKTMVGIKKTIETNEQFSTTLYGDVVSLGYADLEQKHVNRQFAKDIGELQKKQKKTAKK